MFSPRLQPSLLTAATQVSHPQLQRWRLEALPPGSCRPKQPLGPRASSQQMPPVLHHAGMLTEHSKPPPWRSSACRQVPLPLARSFHASEHRWRSFQHGACAPALLLLLRCCSCTLACMPVHGAGCQCSYTSRRLASVCGSAGKHILKLLVPLLTITPWPCLCYSCPASVACPASSPLDSTSCLVAAAARASPSAAALAP